MIQPALASVPPHIPFLDALAAWWLAQQAGRQDASADALFLLPTRRAARGLTEAFLRATAGAPLLLPRITALGALDEAPLAMAGVLDLPQPVPSPRRLAVLTRLVLAMQGRHGAPTLADRAWLLAQSLADLLDEAARAGVDLARELPHATAGDFAAHWNVTVTFLRIVTRAWPAWLAENGLADVAARQIGLIAAQTRLWQAHPPAGPVIAAGSTGAIPAVGDLLSAVARMPGGLVVLPGLDTALDAASWEALTEAHPQAGLRDLLARMGVRREDVAVWDSHPAIAPAERVATLRLALLPAESLGQWHDAPSPDPAGLCRLLPDDQQEEASAIALVLREAVEQPGATAALVTPDRTLAQRVAAELLRFGIVADDSAGEALAETPAALFLRLLAVAVAERLRPVPLLALLKHPLAAAGLSQAACRRAARALERAALRGAMPAPGLAGLRLARADAALLDRLESCLAPLQPHEDMPRAAATLLRGLLEAAEALATTDTTPGAARLWQGEEGEALAGLMADLLIAFTDLPPIAAADLPGLLDAAMQGIAVRSRRALRGRDGSAHPRIFILGLLEARLQSADTIVLGGLVEGVWPPQPDPGPWLNRRMRANLGLPSPELLVGQAAHDFVSAACGARHAVLCAPKRRDRAPAVPSRWLSRLQAVLDGFGDALPVHPAAAWARALDRPEGPARPVAPPAPRPAVTLRPRRLRVTDIETWFRDPYAIYARHVLALKRLDPLEQSTDAADYGTVVHAGLHLFFDQFGATWPADASPQLRRCMDEALADRAMRPALTAWWRPRLHRIATWVADAEAMRRAELGRPRLIRSEAEGQWQMQAPAGPFLLVGRADRVERLFDGGIAILDYKTGTLPTRKDVEEGRSPQLPLEGAMVCAGAFGAEVTGQATNLTYWHISGGFKPGESRMLFAGKPADIAQIVQRAERALCDIVAAFDSPDHAYLSQPHPGAAPRFSDYARLARVAEWSATED